MPTRGKRSGTFALRGTQSFSSRNQRDTSRFATLNVGQKVTKRSPKVLFCKRKRYLRAGEPADRPPGPWCTKRVRPHHTRAAHQGGADAPKGGKRILGAVAAGLLYIHPVLYIRPPLYIHTVVHNGNIHGNIHMKLLSRPGTNRDRWCLTYRRGNTAANREKTSCNILHCTQ